jgi:hypothetical protein
LAKIFQKGRTKNGGYSGEGGNIWQTFVNPEKFFRYPAQNKKMGINKNP